MTLTTEQRTERLQAAISGYVAKGYTIQSQTATAAQLVKPRRFGFWDIVLTLFTVGFWLIAFFARKGGRIYISVDEYGAVQAQ